MSKGKLFSLSVTFINTFPRYNSKEQLTFSQDTELRSVSASLWRGSRRKAKAKEPLLKTLEPKEALFTINSVYPNVSI